MCSSMTDSVSLITGESEVMVKPRPPMDADEGREVRTPDWALDEATLFALGCGGSDCVLEAEGIRGDALATADCAALPGPVLMRVALPLLASVPFGAGVVYTVDRQSTSTRPEL